MSQVCLSVVDMTCEFEKEPIGINGEPTLGWKLTGACGQRSYRVRVASDVIGMDLPDMWDSGWRRGDEMSVKYEGKAILSLARVYWRVDVEDSRGERAFSLSTWKQGIEPRDWRGEWIGYDEGRDEYDSSVRYYCADDFDKGENHPFLPAPPCLRFEFDLNRFSEIKEATLYVSAFGLADVRLNGRRAVTGSFIPGVCDYAKRAYYRAFDVKERLREGENAFCCVLADGLYAGYAGLNPREWWGKKPRLNMQLEIEYDDGSRQSVLTNRDWKAAFGPWLYADVMHGAGYDARKETAGFDLPNFDESGWQSVDTGAEYPHTPARHPGVPIIEHERWKAEVEREGDIYKIDCKKCFSGVLSLKLRGERGAQIDVYHAEELENGELYLRANRSAQAHDRYILKGEGEESFEPMFTYHGFRYARIEAAGAVEVVSVEAVAVSSELPGKTCFHCENEVVDTVYRLIENTLQSNMFDHPTDVNARDERLGWGAEGHFFMYTASRMCFNARFLRKWMRDIADGQQENGAFWATAPAVMMNDILPFAGDLQSDMGVHVCWLMLRLYGDKQSVSQYFPALERYFAFQLRNSDRLVRFATARDWLDIASPDSRSDFDHGYGNCPAGLLGTIYFARTASMMADMAGAIDMPEKARYYNEKFAEIRRAFHTFFVRRDGLLKNATQGAYLASAAFGLLDDNEIAAAREWVKNDFCARGATWGTATTPVALYGLEKLGLTDLACRFVASTDYPSIGYMASRGATAVWERWDGIYDGKFHPHAMNAFDHIGLATVGDWMIGGLAGAREKAPGFSEILFAPAVDENIGGAEASFESVRGHIACRWHADKTVLDFSCSVPTGSTGEIELPCDSNARVDVMAGEDVVAEKRVENGKLFIKALSGDIKLRIFRL